MCQVSTALLRLETSDDSGVALPAPTVTPVVENDAALKALLRGLSGVDAVGAPARATTLAKRSLKKSTKPGDLDLAVSAAGVMKRVLRAARGDASLRRRRRAVVGTSTAWHTIGQQ